MTPKMIQASKTPEPSTLTFTGSAVIEIEAAADGQPKKRPTFTITGYTGAVMNVTGFYSPVIVDLNGLKASRERLPILLNHDPDRVLGQGTATIDTSGVRLTGTITGDDEHAANVVTHSRNGFEWQASIGASIVRQEFLKAGEKAVVNGREVSGPLLIARESRLKETSIVAIGADDQTTATVAASNPSGPLKGALTVFDNWLQAKGFDPTALTDDQKAALKAAYDATLAPPAPAPAPTPTPAAKSLADIIAAKKKNEARITQLTAIAELAITRRPALIDEIEAMAKAAIEAGSQPDDFELQLLRLTDRANIGPAIHSRSPITAPKVIEAALCASAGLSNIEKHYDAKILEAMDQRFRHGITLTELLLMAARETGFTGSPRDERAMLEHAFLRASGFSTISLSGILSNTGNKFLRESFMSTEQTWQRICTFRTVNNFLTHTTYSLTGNLDYEEVGPTGEIKHGTLGEESYTNRAKTYAKMLAITRQDIRNDDLGALMAIPRRLGRGGGNKMNNVFWTEFLASRDTFWASGHSNVITGTSAGSTSALSSEGLKTASTKFTKQTDPDGQPLGIDPRILLVPPELETTAIELMTSLAINTGGSATATQVPNRNIWASKYRVEMSRYISNTAYTGYSLTQWFLLAEPNELSTIEVALLDGKTMPVIESAEADFDVMGVQFRGYHDFGVAKQEYRASVRAAGA
jgi:phage head maturation protease